MAEAAPSRPLLARRLAAEAVGTALLLAVAVGSGIMGERLADGNDAIALLGNTLATGAGLVVLILVFGPVSGAHWRRPVAWGVHRHLWPASRCGGGNRILPLAGGKAAWHRLNT